MSKTMYSHICDYCGKEHFVTTSLYNKFLRGERKHLYCSRKCSSLAQKDSIKSTCDYCGVEILYLWECDLVNNFELCNKLVIEYINNGGILKNYNSFNYHLEDGDLSINDHIVVPYQEIRFDEYKNKIIEKVS